jgi:excisionase family DNA binding protein
MESIVLTADTIPAFLAEFLKTTPTNTPPPDTELLTIAETCQWLKVSRQTLYQRIKAGHFKAYGVGTRHIRLRRSEVLAALEQMGK